MIYNITKQSVTTDRDTIHMARVLTPTFVAIFIVTIIG